MPRLPIRVAIVDDHDLFREGVVALLNFQSGFTVVGQGSTSEEAVEIAVDVDVDVLLLDVELNGRPASTTIRRILRESAKTRVVVLTMHRDRVLRDQLLQAGATAYLTKSVHSDELISTIENVYATGVLFSKTPNGKPRHALLSARELEVLSLLAQARSNKQIGLALSIAEGTVKRHLNSISRKLNTRSRMEVVQKARTLGLLDMDIR